MKNDKTNRRLGLRVGGIGLLVVLCWTQSGCQIFQRFRAPKIKAPVVFDSVPSQDELLQKLNQQSASVKQVRAEVRVAMNGIPGRLKGTLMLERPRRLRLKAGLLGVKELGVDVGSNDELFWIWSRANLPGTTPALFYATHREYQYSQLRNAIPIEPTWLIDALGFIDFKPTDRHEGPFQRQSGHLELRTYHQSATNPTIRVSVIDPEHGWIVQQAIYGLDRQLIAWVKSDGHKYYPEQNVSLPQKVEIHVTQTGGQPLVLTVDAEEYSVNSIYGDPNRLWSVPNPEGVPKIDLTQVSNSPVPNNPVGGAPVYGNR